MSFVIEWVITPMLLLFLFGVFSPSSNVERKIGLARLVPPAEEQIYCEAIELKSPLGEAGINQILEEIANYSRKGYIIAFDDELLCKQPGLLQYLDRKVRLILCQTDLILFNKKIRSLSNRINDQIRWIEIPPSLTNTKLSLAVVKSYEIEEATHLFTVLYVSQRSETLLAARKMGLKTLAVAE